MSFKQNVENTNKTLQFIKANVTDFNRELETAITSPTLSYTEICNVDHQGLYIIFDEKKVIYIGKTNRTGKVRMRELRLISEVIL